MGLGKCVLGHILGFAFIGLVALAVLLGFWLPPRLVVVHVGLVKPADGVCSCLIIQFGVTIL